MLTALRAAIVALAALQAGAAGPVPTVDQPAPTVDQIVAKNLAAKGGEAKLRALDTVKLSGTLTAQGIEVPMTTWAKRPNMMRQEMQLQNKRIVSAFDGASAWVLDERRSLEPQRITGPALEAAKADADFDPVLLDSKEKGTTVTYGGTETIEGTPTWHLTVTTKAGKVQDYYLDAETGLERRTVSTLEQNGLKARVSIDFSDYRDVDGIKMPFSSTQSLNGTVVRRVTLDKVEFNEPIDDAIFKMPAASGR